MIKDKHGNVCPDPFNSEEMMTHHFSQLVQVSHHSAAYKRGFQAGIEREINRGDTDVCFGEFGLAICPFRSATSDYDAWFYGFGAGQDYQIYCVDAFAAVVLGEAKK